MQCHPDCTNDPSDCRITLLRSYVQEPLQEWTLVYDGDGRAISQDPNVYVTEVGCAVCDRYWRIETVAGKEKVT